MQAEQDTIGEEQITIERQKVRIAELENETQRINKLDEEKTQRITQLEEEKTQDQNTELETHTEKAQDKFHVPMNAHKAVVEAETELAWDKLQAANNLEAKKDASNSNERSHT